MIWLSENPWPLAGACAVMAVASLMLLRITQRGRYLAWAGAAIGAAVLVLAIERLWVTDRERVAQVVYDLADAVERGDFDRIDGHLAPEFDQQVGTITRLAMRGAAAPDLQRSEYAECKQPDEDDHRQAEAGRCDKQQQAGPDRRQPGPEEVDAGQRHLGAEQRQPGQDPDQARFHGLLPPEGGGGGAAWGEAGPRSNSIACATPPASALLSIGTTTSREDGLAASAAIASRTAGTASTARPLRGLSHSSYGIWPPGTVGAIAADPADGAVRAGGGLSAADDAGVAASAAR